MKPIQDVDSLSRLLGNHFQVRSPHVAADKFKEFTSLLAKPVKESQQSLFCTLLSNPQQSLAVLIDLVDQRQIAVTPQPQQPTRRGA